LMTGKFEIMKDAAGKFRWRLRASNGEITATGQSYESKQGAKRGIESFKSNAPKAATKERILEINLARIKEGNPQVFESILHRSKIRQIHTVYYQPSKRATIGFSYATRCQE